MPDGIPDLVIDKLHKLSDEFITNMKNMKSGGPDAEVLTQGIVEMELKKETPQQIYNQIKNVSGMGYDATTIHLIKDVNIPYSPHLLSFLCTQSRAIPECISTMLGLYAVKFYETHTKGEKLTAAWVMEQIGHGKIIGHTHIFPYAMACRYRDRNIFDVIDADHVFACYDSVVFADWNPDPKQNGRKVVRHEWTPSS